MRLLSIYFLAITLTFAFVTHGANLCSGKIGQSFYSLEGLAQATGYQDAVTTDQLGNTYYYRPCMAVANQRCKADGASGVCQKDNRPAYHNAGSVSDVAWSMRQSGPASGFILQFTGGEDGRQTTVEFICDSAAGTGRLEAASPTESPVLYYHLKWASSYACPIQGGGRSDAN